MIFDTNIRTSTTNGGTGVNLQQAQLEPPVFNEYGSLDAAIGSLRDRVVALRDRLSPVLIDLCESGGDVKEPEPSLSPFATRIRDDRKRVNQIEDIVGDILQRLQI